MRSAFLTEVFSIFYIITLANQ